ncbi:MAG: hypothetical protein SFW36_23970 [Leptolyngbyaceae cyanobacterium bins.59]|nr:hypothetical protein [Leptolyngbyaceae cyanobacterium bins.59]
MSYSDFTSLEKVKTNLGLVIHDVPRLFDGCPAVKGSDRLQETLSESLELAVAISTEKARSELLVTPILLEVRRLCRNQIGFFSGVDFTIDSSRGLNGACDYLLTANPEQSLVTAPVVTLVEAKNDLLKNGLGQCAAQMYAAWLFNEREGTPQTAIYGAVSTGTNWKFLKFQDNQVQIDLSEYYINQIEQILGILVWSVQSYRLTANL